MLGSQNGAGGGQGRARARPMEHLGFQAAAAPARAPVRQSSSKAAGRRQREGTAGLNGGSPLCALGC